MRLPFLLALTATLATAEPHPIWLAYAPPGATAFVGIQWNHLRHSPLAPAIQAEISPSGRLGLPDLDCLRQAREIVISSPALLVEAAGSFPAAMVQDQAQRLGMFGSVYRGVQLWLPDFADQLGVAQISEQFILVGVRKALQSAVDAGLSETVHPSSPLLSQAARLSQTGDLWVLAAKLPDPLAGVFVPLEADAQEFRGKVWVRDSITNDAITREAISVEASFDAASQEAAAQFAMRLRERASAIAQGLEATADHSRVTIAFQASSEDLMAALHSQPTEASQPATEPEQPAEPVVFAVTRLEAIQPRIIRIFNLEEGTREVTLPLGH